MGIKNVSKKILTFSLCLTFFCFKIFAANNNDLIQGFEAYSKKDWTSASFFLRKAVVNPENSTADVWYMIISSQMYAQNYSSVVNDCDNFLQNFSDSELVPYIEYQKGRALHFLGQNDAAVLTLSDFCHQYPDNKMYASSLYWLGECFFDDYDYESAKNLYETIVAEFPNSDKLEDAQFKLDVIAQREREQKLLYLLKMTGEEYLSSKENYEKQIREYQTQDLVSLRRQLNVANARIKELEDAASQTLQLANQAQQEAQKNALSNSQNQENQENQEQISKNAGFDEEMAVLKAKAALLQSLLNSRNEVNSNESDSNGTNNSNSSDNAK